MVSKTSTSFLFIFFLFLGFSLQAQDGESLFKATCAACHRTTSKKLIGPGLANVHEKRSIEWFKKFVTSSQSLINSGDVDAVKIFEEYNKIIMPDQAFSDAELNALYEYIKSVSPAKTDIATTEIVEEEEVPFEPTEEDIFIGRNLFSGIQRLENGGPSCISCHHVRNDDLVAGGGLAVDLTDVYDRLGKDGIGGMITGLPFPQMKISYQDHQITEAETLQLVAFLKEVSEQRYYQGITSYKNTLLIWGISGAAILMGIFPLIWYKRKKESVNKRIYERQIKSRN
ncbi:MAG: c-type cytochrome [Flavobacteriaceae bacterium]|nr:c-type cytochrome [Flavobacteriaceae bacterium]